MTVDRSAPRHRGVTSLMAVSATDTPSYWPLNVLLSGMLALAAAGITGLGGAKPRTVRRVAAGAFVVFLLVPKAA